MTKSDTRTTKGERECWCCCRIWNGREAGWRKDNDGGDVPGGSLCPECAEEYA